MKTLTSGFQQSYNAQIAVDKDTQLITAADVNQNHNDHGQLHLMIDRSEENTESSIELVYADGDSNKKDLNKLEERNIEGYVATRKAKTYKNPATERMHKKLNQSTWESQIQRKGLGSKKTFCLD